MSKTIKVVLLVMIMVVMESWVTAQPGEEVPDEEGSPQDAAAVSASSAGGELRADLTKVDTSGKDVRKRVRKLKRGVLPRGYMGYSFADDWNYRMSQQRMIDDIIKENLRENLAQNSKMLEMLKLKPSLPEDV